MMNVFKPSIVVPIIEGNLPAGDNGNIGFEPRHENEGPVQRIT
jgi:hypothetical protein